MEHIPNKKAPLKLNVLHKEGRKDSMIIFDNCCEANLQGLTPNVHRLHTLIIWVGFVSYTRPRLHAMDPHRHMMYRARTVLQSYNSPLSLFL